MRHSCRPFAKLFNIFYGCILDSQISSNTVHYTSSMFTRSFYFSLTSNYSTFLSWMGTGENHFLVLFFKNIFRTQNSNYCNTNKLISILYQCICDFQASTSVTMLTV